MAPQHPATFFIGSSFERMVLVHHLSRNCPAQYGDRVPPEELELFFQQIAPDRSQIVLQQLRQLGLLFLLRFSGRLSNSQRLFVSTGS